MANSGISVAESCVNQYIKLQKHHLHRYIIFKIKDQNRVVIHKILAKTSAGHSKDKKQGGQDEEDEPCIEAVEDGGLSPADQYGEFMTELMAMEGAYAVYDAEYTNNHGVKREKVIFILWCPDSSTIKTKMLYTSTKDTIKKKFTGIAAEIQANDSDDLKFDSIKEKIERLKQF